MASSEESQHDMQTRAVDINATVSVPASSAPQSPRVPAYPYRAGELILPGYRLETRLGSGGFGEVWRATAPGGMGVAIKILANLGRAQGGREYRALQTIKNIRHAHIVPIFGVWLKSGDGRVLSEAELVDAERRLLASRGSSWQTAQSVAATVDADAEPGGLHSLELVIAMGLGDQTLFDRLREGRRLGEQAIPVPQLVEWMHQAALALDHFNSGARRRGENPTAVQHCDIKPQNMLLVGDAVQICDFGLARAQGEVRATSNNMASLAYAAPEMVSGSHDPSPSTDQYSLAVSYVELRTGRLPYRELSPLTILKTKLEGTLDLAALPAAERQVLLRSLDVDPARRWPSCVEFVRALRGAATMPSVGDGEAAAAEPSGACGAPGKSQRWHLRRVAIGAVLVVAAAGLTVFLALRPGPPPPTTAAAIALEAAGRFAEAGDAYEHVLADKPVRLAEVLWDLQTKAADAKRFSDCAPLLRRLERLYAASPPPAIKDIRRWDVVNSLAWYLATDPATGPVEAKEATALAEEAVVLAVGDEAIQSFDTAAAAAARAGDFATAMRRIDEAIGVAKDAATRDDFSRRRDAYRAGKAWNQP